MNKEFNGEGKRIFKPIRAIDLIEKVAAEPEPTYLWKGIPIGSTGLVTGVAKTGKTTFAENLAMSLAVGRKDFFGEELDGIPRRVLFVNLEESYRIRSWRNMKQLSALSEDELKLFKENFFSTEEDFPQYISTNEEWEMLRDFILECDPEVLVIDSLSHLYEGDIENSRTALTFTKNINLYLKPLGLTSIIIHHNVKGNDKPIDQDSIAGSRVIMQEFEYAIGFANIPTGGNYSCRLFNKYCENDNQSATLYSINQFNWVETRGVQDKFSLYRSDKADGRIRTDNTDYLLKLVYTLAMENPDVPIKTEILLNELQSSESQTKMGRSTMFNQLKTLVAKNLLECSHGSYGITESGVSKAKELCKG